MVSLVLAIVSAILIAAILRVNEDRGGDRFVVAGCNYLVASLLSLLFAPASVAEIDAHGIIFAVAVGAGFVGGFVAFMRAIREMGLAVPATAARLSTLVPVLGSILMFDEVPTSLQLVGIATGLVAFVVLGFARRRQDANDERGSMGPLLLFVVFAISGCVDFALKVAQESGAARGPFLLVVFLTACAVCLTVVVARRTRVRGREAALGALLGVPNFAASFFILRALGDLAAVVVFPAVNAAIVIGVSLVAMVIWKERPDSATAVGLVLAVLAVVLLGLG